jgi:hypothetical protein
MQLVDEYRSVEDLRSWVASEGLEYVAYRLWDDEFSGYSEEEISQEIVRLLGL